MQAKVIYVLKALFLAFALMVLGRLSLLAFDYADFLPITSNEFLLMFFGGMLFDLLVTLQINSFFIVLIVINVSKSYQKIKQKLAVCLFVGINVISLIINLADAAYFKFSGKRSSFSFIKSNVSEDSFLSLLGQYIYDSWYALIAALLLIYFLFKAVSRVKIPSDYVSQKRSQKIRYSLMGCCFILLFLGALKKIEMRPSAGAWFAKSQHIPLVVNSTFTVLASLKEAPKSQFVYFSKEVCYRNFNPIHPASKAEFKPWNVVFIILESIGEEYTGYSLSQNASSTPFLDSLAKNGLTFEQTYANAHRSIEGIPAIVASIPNAMDDAFITSKYQNNTITSLANTLKKQGYSSAFFHGGANGSMGFDTFATHCGFDSYYGLNEYPNPKDFDGHWGIWDEPFLQFMSQKLDELKQPFAVCEFTLSSHHPYGLPPAYRNKFDGTPFEQSIQYTDHALQLFFKKAKAKPWYKNTIFVITSDHTSSPTSSRYRTDEGTYRIPLVFYKENEPSLHKKRLASTVQHIDILPTLLGLLNYPEPYYSLGKDAIGDRSYTGVILYHNYLYQYVNKNAILQFDGHNPIAYYMRKDRYCTNNVIKKAPQHELNFIKAWLQEYHSALLNNAMH